MVLMTMLMTVHCDNGRFQWQGLVCQKKTFSYETIKVIKYSPSLVFEGENINMGYGIHTSTNLCLEMRLQWRISNFATIRAPTMSWCNLAGSTQISSTWTSGSLRWWWGLYRKSLKKVPFQKFMKSEIPTFSPVLSFSRFNNWLLSGRPYLRCRLLQLLSPVLIQRLLVNNPSYHCAVANRNIDIWTNMDIWSNIV